MNHTPGPWIVRTGKIYGTEHIWVAAPEVVVGHTLAGPVPQDILCDEDYPTKLADAKLIAAAPDMLMALKYIMDDETNLLPRATSACRKVIAAVIEKATK